MFHICIEHFSEDVNAGTASKLSYSPCLMLFGFEVMFNRQVYTLFPIWGHSFGTYAQKGRGSSKSVRHAYKRGWG